MRRLRLSFMLARAALSAYHAALSQPAGVADKQAHCDHCCTVKRGNQHGSGKYCAACGLRVEWAPRAFLKDEQQPGTQSKLREDRPSSAAAAGSGKAASLAAEYEFV